MKSQMNINSIQKVHFIGIGGIGMSSLARHFLFEKKIVSGSDRDLTDITKALASEGVQVMSPQVEENITEDIELVIYTEAMGADHPEMKAAKQLGLPMCNYFDALGLAMNPYYLIAVAGSHGKTTTTAMLTDVFEAAEKDPTAVIGSLRAKTGSNYRPGKSKYAIVEACEYKEDFLSLTPEVLVITNLEHEHVDYYKSLEGVQQAFKKLIAQVSETGVIVTNPKDPNIAPILEGCGRKVIDYTEQFEVALPLKQPGMHNRLNAAAAMTAAMVEDIASAVARTAMLDFRGTWRRFEYKGEINGAPLYDDYAHHPTEIIATVAAVAELYPDRRIVTIFKPHTYTRTVEFFDDFARSFAGVHEALFLPIYGAREENVTGVTSRELAVKTLEFVPDTQYFGSHEAVEQYVKKTIGDDSVVVVMGAGDVTQVAKVLTS
jgi:UDP-N-acetylmuramate--alanine ligase